MPFYGCCLLQLSSPSPALSCRLHIHVQEARVYHTAPPVALYLTYRFCLQPFGGLPVGGSRAPVLRGLFPRDGAGHGRSRGGVRKRRSLASGKRSTYRVRSMCPMVPLGRCLTIVPKISLQATTVQW